MEVADAVRAAFPGRVVDPEGEGQLNRAFRIGEDLLARVPRHAFGIARLRFEVELLPTIRPFLGVRVPEIVTAVLDRPAGEAYVVHRRIPGRVLSPETVRDLPADRLERIGRQIGVFLLRHIHRIDPAELDIVPRLGPAALAEQLQSELDSLPARLLGAEQRRSIHRDLEGLAALPESPSVLCHTDIGGNVLVSDGDDEIGIIDFGSCLVSHPALDLASLSVLGDDVVRAAVSEYPLLGGLAAEAAAVRRTFALQDALYGARQEDWTYVGEAISGLAG